MECSVGVSLTREWAHDPWTSAQVEDEGLCACMCVQVSVELFLFPVKVKTDRKYIECVIVDGELIYLIIIPLKIKLHNIASEHHKLVKFFWTMFITQL